MLAELKTTYPGAADIFRTEEFQVTCTDLELPNLGQLTRTELINFIDVHTQRHIHQLENIAARLVN